MYESFSTVDLFQLIEDKTEALIEVMELFACLFWQDASDWNRKKYPRFALPRPEFNRRYREYGTSIAARPPRALLPGDAATLVNEIVPLPGYRVREEHVEARDAGRMLARMSLALCYLGEDASPGDVEAYLDLLREDGAISAAERRHFRKPAGRKELLILLNRLLELAAAEIVALSDTEDILEQSFLRIDIRTGTVSVNQKLIRTEYVILESILGYLEPGSSLQ